jgi:FKBP-type peptidyl-prolyl cis-trans isomerase SlyD
MNIEQDKVVSIHYTLKNNDGKIIDTSSGGEPLAYLHGSGNIIVGLERALEGRKVGDKFKVRIEPADAYGPRDASLLQQVPRRSLQGLGKITPGMQFQSKTPQGMRVFKVLKVIGDMVAVDGNHPLAGETLNFEIEIASVRDASPEEIDHGHIHGPGGHHH